MANPEDQRTRTSSVDEPRSPRDPETPRKPYDVPRLVRHGTVKDRTRAGIPPPPADGVAAYSS